MALKGDYQEKLIPNVMLMPVTIFLLRRLPSLAVDHVIRVMDPLEQLLLCRTSRKLKSCVRRITKNYVFHLTGFTDSMSFGYAPEKSSQIMIQNDLPSNKEYLKIYLNPSTMYSWSDLQAFSAMTIVIKDEFAPKDFTMHFPLQEQFRIYAYFADAPWNYYFVRERFYLERQVSMSDNHIIPEISDTDSSCYLRVKDSNWITFDDLKKLFNFDRIELAQTSFTSEQLNQFCGIFIEKWMAGQIKTADLSLSTPRNIELEVAGGVLVDGQSMDNFWEIHEFAPTTCYVVERADGKKAYMCCKEKNFWLYVD